MNPEGTLPKYSSRELGGIDPYPYGEIPTSVFQELFFQTWLSANERFPQAFKPMDCEILTLILRYQPQDLRSVLLGKPSQAQIDEAGERMNRNHKHTGQVKSFTDPAAWGETKLIELKTVDMNRFVELYERAILGTVLRFLIYIDSSAQPFPEREDINDGRVRTPSEKEISKIVSFFAVLGSQKDDKRRRDMIQAAATIEDTFSSPEGKWLSNWHKQALLRQTKDGQHLQAVSQDPQLGRYKRLIETTREQTTPSKLMLICIGDELAKNNLPRFGLPVSPPHYNRKRRGEFVRKP